MSTPFELRQRMRGCDRAVLGTVACDDGRGLEGYPSGSLALASFDHAGHPLLLLSRLAHHARNLALDPRASLHFELERAPLEPLAGARLVLFGRAGRAADERLLARVLRRHPEAALYAALDFELYRLVVERVHVNGGYGAARWFSAGDFAGAEPEGLAAAEEGVVGHINDEHREALALLARHAGFAEDAWRMTGIDPDGFDLRGERSGLARIAFDRPLLTAAEVRPRLVALTRAARAALGG